MTTRLRGRGPECERLDRLVATMKNGHSAVLVLRGDAGIGKTALLEYVREEAGTARVARAAGAESEMELAFGGLHQLCAPFLDRLDRLPAPQREALETAFGLSAGTPPDRFLVGLAVLSLLSAVAEEKPLLCLVDDAQWLDRVSSQTLTFVARRLLAEPIGLVLATREPELTELPQLEVGRLGVADSRALLDAVTPGRLDERVRDRIVAETQGNPLALLELPRGLTPAELAGGFGRPDARPVASQIEESFLRRVRALPTGTQLLLLVAAAEPVGDVSLLTRAAALLGIDATAAGPAESAGLITLGSRVRFRHPLVRSAAYRAAEAHDRQRVHAALADATDPRTDPDRRAWHRANAATEPDEEVAAELERSAGRAQGRGGVAAAAAFLERAAELTPDPARRGVRLLAGAQAKYQAGGYDSAHALLDAAELGPLDEEQRARSSLLRGRVVFASRSAGTALPLLLQAAKRLEPLDAGTARETYRDALYAALTAGRLPSGAQLPEVARAARGAPARPFPGREDLLLDGLAVMVTDGYAKGVPMVLEALQGFPDALGWLPLACRMGHDAWDFASWSVLSARLVGLARERGALAVLPSALLLRLSNRVFAGELDEAESLAAEAVTIGEATGSRFFAQYGALVIGPWRGREAEVRRVIEPITQDPALRGEGKVLTATQWASAVLHNGLGRYEEAYVAAEGGCEHPQELGLSTWSTVELVEAAARSGRPERAAEAAARITEMARANGTDWALGTAAAARAQVSQGATADRLAGDGLTNPEIGARLFISPHTVEWHLRKVFAKLGIASRKQIRGTLATA
ncbi:ATP-binding protein [Actinoplanes solisilvae]|uniref:ATP-binding protein n=1 Tax=Actinoplanes solisilvae TaxID=2486853 RepID=UPI00196A79EB|nr:LuxR family transcriptional regulator [Actinoplanes solisilvae]